MTWLRRKPVRVLGIVLAVLLLAGLAVKIFLPAEKVRDLALAQARAGFGREVGVGQVTVTLRGGLGVKLADFVIHNPEGFDGDPLLTTRVLELKLALGPLLKGEIRVHRLVVDAPVVNLVRLADGRNNFTFMPTDTTSGSGTPAADTPAAEAPPPISVASLTLRDGKIGFSDAMATEDALQALRISGLTLGMSLTDPAPGRFQVAGRLAADEILVTGPAAIPPLNSAVDFDITWDTDSSRLDIAQATVQVNNLSFTCQGHVVTAGEVPTGEIKVQLTDWPLVELAAFAPPEVAGKIQGDRRSGLVGAVVNLDLTGDQAVPVHISGTATARNVDLALAQPFLPPQQKGSLAGRSDLDLIFADKTGDPALMIYSGKLTTRGVSFTASDLMDELENLDADLYFTQDVFTVEMCRAKFAYGTFDLTGRLRDPFPYFLPPELQAGKPVKTPHLDFNLHSARLDVDRLMPAASPAGGAAAGTAGPGTTRAPIDMEFPDLSCDGTFSADSLIYMQVPLTRVRGKVRLRDRVISVHDVKGAVYHGRIDGQVDIDLKDLNDPVYTGQYRARDIEVDNFMTRFVGLTGVVFGGCNMRGEFNAHGLDPEVIRNGLTLDADAGIKKGKVVTTGNVHAALNKLATEAGQTLAREQALKDLVTHISVENGRVGLSALTTRLGQFGDLTVDGYYAFSGELNYAGTVLLTRAQTDQLFSGGLLGELGKLLGDERPVRLEIPLSVGGTQTDPRVKLDLGAVTSDLQQRVVKAQGKKLEEEAKSKLGDLLKKWK